MQSLKKRGLKTRLFIRTVSGMPVFQALESIIHKYSLKMHKILAQKLYSGYGVNYTSFFRPSDFLCPFDSKGFRSIQCFSELHRLTSSPDLHALLRSSKKLFFGRFFHFYAKSANRCKPVFARVSATFSFVF